MPLKTTTCTSAFASALTSVLRFVLVMTTACSWFDRSSDGEPGPSSVLKVETSIHSRLVENSVAVTSVSQAGVIFGLNDSGNGPYLFAFDSAGKGHGYWEITGAQNRDWEAAAAGPCPASASQPDCLYVGDV